MHIVVTCANRKRYPVPVQLRLGALRERRPSQRFTAWTRRLADGSPLAPARDMYAGEHWQIAANLPMAAGRPATLWVCSAGYGLIGAHTAIRPYAATFASREKDSVGESLSAARDWWYRLTNWPGPAADQPRSFADLARRDPNATIVAVLSDAYLRACADDLRVAADLIADRDQFAVIGPPAPGTDVDELVVPVTARLRPVVGGSLQALHVRAARYLLAAAVAGRHPASRPQLRQLVQQAADAAPPDLSRRPAGQRLTDDAVRAYIRATLATGPATATALLRLLRVSGQSCEQSRFKQLFADVTTEEANG